MSSRIGRNSQCPCNSGRKFKHCCMTKIAILDEGFQDSMAIDVQKFLPSTIQFILEVPDDIIKPDTAEYWPVMVIGSSMDAVEFEGSTQDLPPQHLMRVGFCNREWRILLQVRTDSGTFSLVDDHVLVPGIHEIVAIFDTDRGCIELYVNGDFTKREALKGQQKLRQSDLHGIGHNRVLPVFYVNYFFGTLTPGEIAEYRKSASRFSGSWAVYPDGSRNLNRLDTVADGLAYSWVSAYYHALFERDNSLTDRILEQFGEANFAEDDPPERTACAINHVEQLVSSVQQIIDDEASTENDLLKLFKKHPQVAMLLDFNVEEQWREQTLQGYGRIDFVFRLIGNRYVAVEIESHCCTIFTATNEFSSHMNHAINQVDKWITGASKLPHLINKTYQASGAEQFSKLVVAGRRSQISNQTREELWNTTQQKGVMLLTWDDVVDRGAGLLKKLCGIFASWS